MRVVVAFDADKRELRRDGKLAKPGVVAGEAKLVDAFQADHDVFTAEWPAEHGKGIDDLLTAGGSYRLVARYQSPRPRPRVPRPCPRPGPVDEGVSVADAIAETQTRVGRRFQHLYRGTAALIATPPGLSKSGSVLREQEVRNVNVSWGLARHALAGELVDRAESEPCRCDRRRADCPQHAITLQHDRGRNDKNCVCFDVVAAAQEAGYGAFVGRWICGSARQPICRFFLACEYQAQFHRPGSHVAAFETVIQRPTSTAHASAVVFDDLDSSRLIESTQLHPAVIARARKRRSLAGIDELLDVLEGCMRLAPSEGVYHREAYDLLAQVAAGPGQTLEALLTMIPPIDAFAPQPTAAEYRAALPGQLASLVAFLREEFVWYRSGRPFTSGIRIHQGSIELGRLKLPTENDEGMTSLSGKSVTVLTSTPDPILRQWLSGLDKEILRETAPRVALPAGVRVIQDVSGFYGKGAVARVTTAESLIKKAADYLAELRPQRPAAITHKDLAERVRSGLGLPADRVLYYGNQRGSNVLRDADCLLVIGTPGMSPEVAYWQTCAAFRGEGEPPSRKMRMERRAYGGWTDGEGRGREVEVLSFVDPRVAEVLETARRDELVQAIYRCRPFDMETSNERIGIDIVILSEFPIEGLRIDDLRWGALAGRAEAKGARIAAAHARLIERGVAVTLRTLASEAGTSQSQAGAFLREVSAVCTPTPNKELIGVGVQAAETSSALQSQLLPAACQCPPCPANRGLPCDCGRYWFTDSTPIRVSRCGVHDPVASP